MDERHAEVRVHDEVRRARIGDDSTAALGPVIQRHELEVLHHFGDDVDRSAEPGARERPVGGGVVGLEPPDQHRGVDVLVGAFTGLRVECHLADDVGVGVGRRARRADNAATGPCIDLAHGKGLRQHDAAADVLLGILQRDARGHRVAGVDDEAEAWRALPGETHLVVRVHVLTEEDVPGHGRQTVAARCDEAPRLPAKKLELSLLILGPIEAHAQAVRIARDVEVLRRIAEEVGFEIALQTGAIPLAGRHQREPGVLG